MIPYFCRRCSEMLADGQDQCPFCDGMATPVDELIDEASRELGCLGMHDHARAIALLTERAPLKSAMPNLRSGEV
jgi:hypothetical protein